MWSSGLKQEERVWSNDLNRRGVRSSGRGCSLVDKRVWSSALIGEGLASGLN